MKKSLLLAFAVVLLVTVGAVSYYNYIENQYREALAKTVSQDDERVKFTIEKGQSAKDIAAALFDKKVIVNDGAFVRYIKEKNLDQNLKSGNFVLYKNDTIPAIADVLTGKTVREITITIPEGYTVKQIDELLKKNNLVKGNEFLDCIENCTFDYDFLKEKRISGLEGFLFPSTYFIDPTSFTAESFINRLLSTFNNQLAPFRKDIAEGKMYDTVIMASLIERETRTGVERPVVSGILWKRLENRWYLGVDATLRYVKNDWYNPLTYKELADKSNPYNTRTNHGLPPTPIANAGLESLKAAVYPESSEYWYYLHDSEGSIHYGRNEKEHEANKVKYIY